MPETNARGKAPIIPTLRYRDAAAAGIGTQSAYVIVPDADAHHARAVAAGAEIVYPLKDEDYGGRGYSCRDPEGHLWNFGTYDPWSEPAS